MANTPQVADGFVGLPSGMQGADDPALIPATAYARGINVTVRGGMVRSRAGFTSLGDLTGTDFQGAGIWTLPDKEMLVFVTDGKVYVRELNAAASTASVYYGTFFATDMAPCYFVQVDMFMLIQDGYNRPVVLEEDSQVGIRVRPRDAIRDSATLVSGQAAICLVPGTVGHYAHGRIHYVPFWVPALTPNLPQGLPVGSGWGTAPNQNYDAIPDASNPPIYGRSSIVSSDILDPLNPEWVFRMSEHRVLNEGGAMGIPGSFGSITALSSFRNASVNGTGAGDLVVFAQYGVYALGVAAARTTWKTNPIGKVLFSGVGSESPRGVAQINDDIVFLDSNGHLRTVRYTRNTSGGATGALSCVPLSRDVTPFVSPTGRALASVAAFDDRAVFTIGNTGDYFQGVCVLDTAPLYTLSASASGAVAPAFDGVWTGFRFRQLLTGRRDGVVRLLAVVDKPSGGLALISFDPTSTQDYGGTPIYSRLETRAYNFQSPTTLKRLEFVDVWVQDLTEDVDMNVYIRPAGYPLWQMIGSRHLTVPAGGLPQSRGRIRFAVPATATVADPVSRRQLRSAVDFQVALEWEGHLVVSKMQLIATQLSEVPPAMCDETSGVVLAAGVASGVQLADYGYEVTL